MTDPEPVDDRDANPRVLLIGASVRALADSARRAGWQCVASDIFGDVDLRSIAEYEPVSDYPAGFLEVARKSACEAVVYTGGIENSPDLIGEIAHHCRILGCDAAAVSFARDPQSTTQLLRESGLPAPDVAARGSLPQTGRWISKPVRRAGGLSVSEWRGEALEGDRFLQRFVSGLSVSSLHLARRDSVELIGTTIQLVGLNSVRAQPYAYCGSIGPVELPDNVTAQIASIGRLFGQSGSFRGLFGMDLVINDDGVWTIEVNPRYTASVEVFERAWGESLLTDHRAACESFGPGDCATDRQRRRRAMGVVVGKLILFADRSTTAPDITSLFSTETHDAGPPVADIPFRGSRIDAGHPICTVLASGPSIAACLYRLDDRASTLTQNLFNRPAGVLRELQHRLERTRSHAGIVDQVFRQR